MRLVYAAFAFLFSRVALASAPLLLALHRLVPNLRDHLRPGIAYAHNESSITHMLKYLVTQCLLDAYLLVDQPGLRYEDLVELRREWWPFLRRYTTLASLIVGLPWIQTPIDFDHFEQYIVKTCEAETMRADGDEGDTFYDTRKRVVRVRLRPLPMDGKRNLVAIENDEVLRKILRKLPSPHYTIIFSTSEPGPSHPIPPSVVENDPEKYTLFNDIFNHPSREVEVERNDNFHKAEPQWPENRHTNQRYLRNKILSQVHLFDIEHWTKYERLVTTIALMVLGLLALKVFRVTKALVTRGGKVSQPPKKRD